MMRVCVVCEGPTEVEFIRTAVAPHLNNEHFYLFPSIIQAPSGRHRGGRVTVERLVNFMRHQYYEADRLTTFVDFYGFQDANGRSASVLENEILQGLVQQGLQAHRIMPYLQMYEFEALLFSDVDKFEYVLDGWNVRVKEQLLTISQQFLTPEAINNHPSTAPSKRILNVFPAGTYSKTIHGPIIAEEIGIDTLRQRCPGFNGWIERLEQWKAMSQP